MKISDHIKKPNQLSVGWQSPSNIALVKYWGKKPIQIPINPSISMTLSEAVTQTEIKLKPKNEHTETIAFDFYFENEKKNSFNSKLSQFFERVQDHFPWLKYYQLTIKSSNTFPHSAGIASSASAMSALALCLCALDPEISIQCEEVFQSKASEVARLGSGSACRSIYPEFAMWGQTDFVDNSSDQIAIPLQEIHNNFQNLHDAIIIVSDHEKPISSSTGHKLMEEHDFKEARIKQAHLNCKKLLKAMTGGSWNDFVEIVEHEALTLHALMMSSNPGYILLNSESLKIIDLIRKFRKENQINCCFTIDAGPNIHLLYDGAKKQVVEQFINEELIRYCGVVNVLYDHIGSGPKRLK